MTTSDNARSAPLPLTSVSECDRIHELLAEEARHNPLVYTCLRSLRESGRDTEAVLLNTIRVLTARAKEQDEAITRLLLEKPLRPMALGDHTGKVWLFTPPGWKGPT